jgi:hypothetical protein
MFQSAFLTQKLSPRTGANHSQVDFRPVTDFDDKLESQGMGTSVLRIFTCGIDYQIDITKKFSLPKQRKLLIRCCGSRSESGSVQNGLILPDPDRDQHPGPPDPSLDPDQYPFYQTLRKNYTFSRKFQ